MIKSTEKIFYDSEFTGLHAASTLISVGFVAEGGETFYAEFTDYNRAQCDNWINQHVVAHCRWLAKPEAAEVFHRETGMDTECLGDKTQVRGWLTDWLARYKQIEVWSDCHAYDWVLLCELFGGALHMPSQVFYMPMDLVTLFRLKGINPDTDRLRFSGIKSARRHNALDDARMARACYDKLIALPDSRANHTRDSQ